MNLYLKRGSRYALKHFSLGCYVFFLALCVFGWGLHSKLSLYESNTAAQASTPIAKLLSEQERAPDHQSQHAQLKPVQLFVIYAAISPRPVEIYRPWRDVLHVKPVAFSFDGPSLLRPPPSPVA
ncbi:MAG: hypothetical protein QOE55_799 [Acidobacteriaceae bacterium]|jgi:hypothetical protein|nr:hypothetical protein [Acidobacteriaceae bacterium]